MQPPSNYVTIDEFSEILLASVKAGRIESELTRRNHPDDVGFMFEIAAQAVTATLSKMIELRRESDRRAAEVS